MQLLTIFAFALLFWQAEDPGRFVLVPDGDWVWTISSVVLLPLMSWTLGRMTTRIAIRRISSASGAIDSAHRSYARSTVAIRALLLVGFAWVVFGTNWANWLRLGRFWRPLQLLGDVAMFLPFASGLIALWLATFPLEQLLRTQGYVGVSQGKETPRTSWTRRSYLDFHARHYLLIVAVPMILVLFAADMVRAYEVFLRSTFHWYWAPEAVLSVTAGLVFLTAPVLLTRIWHTRPLAKGVLRSRLEDHCCHIGLGVRDILVWQSDGMMINAAVMGVIPTFRYVLLSDALLDTMSHEQVLSVFGHEAGHATQRHIQYFLLFAFIGWVLASGTMEFLAVETRTGSLGGSSWQIGLQVVGGSVAVVLWGIGFGWISRRFERQADICGAQAVDPGREACRWPCSVHLAEHTFITDEESTDHRNTRVCMTGARVFASALDRVANLSGIPREEHSWRHASIGHRIRMLMAAAGDPSFAARFLRMIRRLKLVLLIAAVLGALASSYYFETATSQRNRPTRGQVRVAGGDTPSVSR